MTKYKKVNFLSDNDSDREISCSLNLTLSDSSTSSSDSDSSDDDYQKPRMSKLSKRSEETVTNIFDKHYATYKKQKKVWGSTCCSTCGKIGWVLVLVCFAYLFFPCFDMGGRPVFSDEVEGEDNTNDGNINPLDNNGTNDNNSTTNTNVEKKSRKKHRKKKETKAPSGCCNDVLWPCCVFTFTCGQVDLNAENNEDNKDDSTISGKISAATRPIAQKVKSLTTASSGKDAFGKWELVSDSQTKLSWKLYDFGKCNKDDVVNFMRGRTKFEGQMDVVAKSSLIMKGVGGMSKSRAKVNWVDYYASRKNKGYVMMSPECMDCIHDMQVGGMNCKSACMFDSTSDGCRQCVWSQTCRSSPNANPFSMPNGVERCTGFLTREHLVDVSKLVDAAKK